MLSNNKFLIFAPLIIFGCVLFLNAGLIFAASSSADDVPMAIKAPEPNVTSGNLPGLIKDGKRADFIEFLGWFYPFLLSVAAVLAVVMIVIAGVQWAGSMGSEAAITSAKDKLTNAILGLVLAFSAWLILNTINPDLVKLKLKGEIKAANQIALIR